MAEETEREEKARISGSQINAAICALGIGTRDLVKAGFNVHTVTRFRQLGPIAASHPFTRDALERLVALLAEHGVRLTRRGIVFDEAVWRGESVRCGREECPVCEAVAKRREKDER